MSKIMLTPGSGGSKPKAEPSSYLPTYITVYIKTRRPPTEPAIPNDVVAFVPPAPTISTSPTRPSNDVRPGGRPPQPASSDPRDTSEQQARPDERRGGNSATDSQEQSKPDFSPDEEQESETAASSAERAWSYEDIFLSMDAVDLSYYSSLQEYDLVRNVAIALRHEKFILHYLDNPVEYLKHFATYTWDEEADAAAEEFIQWYVERFRPELERQLDIDISGPAFGDVENKIKDLTVGDVEDAIKDPTFGAAEDTITRWHKDLTNDEREVVIAIDLRTGETLFVRYGDEDSVALQDEQKKLVEDRYIALLHHHPNNSAASLADLDAADWLKTEFLLVTNPDGTLHRYARVGEAMIPLEPTRNPEYVAPVDPLETLAADVAYLAQTLREIGDPPEMVMRQEPNEDEITINTDSRLVDEFLLNPATVVFLDDVAKEYGVEDPSFFSAMVATIIYRELRGFGSLEFAGHPSNQHFWDYLKVTGNAIPYFSNDSIEIGTWKLDGDPSLGIGALSSKAVERILSDAEAKNWDVYVPLLGYDLSTTFEDVPFERDEHNVTMHAGSELSPIKHSLRVIPPTSPHGAWRIGFPDSYVPGLHGIQSKYEPTLGLLAAEVAIAMRSTQYKDIAGVDSNDVEDRQIGFLIANHANRSAIPAKKDYNPTNFTSETEEEIRWVADFEELMDARRTEIQGGT